MKSVFITGANAGLGKELARQLAVEGVEKIYLGCRNLTKAKAAKKELEAETGKDVFEIREIDVSNLLSVKAAVSAIQEPIDGLVMNAGGNGGDDFLELQADGVTNTFATNVLGHAALLEGLLEADKLTKVGVFAGTEVIRGVPEMGIKKPTFESSSIEEFVTVADGTMFKGVKDPVVAYGPVKYVGVLWLAALSRRYPAVRLVSMSPGGTTGTEGLKGLPPVKRLMFSGMMRVMASIGRMHSMDVGAKRHVEALTSEVFESGKSYASAKGVSGPVADQGEFLPDLWDEEVQDNAYKAIHQFIDSGR